jgi:hypothetical protein
MFNLLVKSQSWGDGRDTIPDDRAFEYTEQRLVDKFKPGGQLDFKALAALPTLFVQETSGQNAQVARVGTITSARMNAPNIVFEYTYDPGIPAVPNKTLQRFAVDLDINKYEFSRTHWSVKGVDLYRTLLRKFRRQRIASRTEIRSNTAPWGGLLELVRDLIEYAYRAMITLS